MPVSGTSVGETDGVCVDPRGDAVGDACGTDGLAPAAVRDGLAKRAGWGRGPSGIVITAITSPAATSAPATTAAVQAERNESSRRTNYYTACGMNEYTSASADPNPADPPAPDLGQSGAEIDPVEASTPRRRTLIGPFTARQLGLINAIVVGAALVLFVVTRPIGGDSAGGVQPAASFYRISAETQGLELGQRAPDFTGKNGEQDVRLTDLDGREIRLADFAGKPVWVVFWATWCPPCQQETPDVRAVFEANRDAGLVVVAVDVQEPVDTARGYAERYGLTYTIGVDTYAAIMRTYRVFGLPTHYFIDRQGAIRDRYFGPLKRDQMERRVALISQP